MKTYSGLFQLSEDPRSIALLDSISQLPEDSFLKALYFNVFNRILGKADGGIAELMGNYNLKLILSDPKYVINYFKKKPEIMRQYAQSLGYEFYFKQDGTSAIKYSFDEFKSILNSQLGDVEYASILNIFYDAIKINMNRIN